MGVRDAFVWAVCMVPVVAACGAAGTTSTNSDNFGWVQAGDDYASPGEGGFDVRWSRQLTQRSEARFLPLQLGSAEFDLNRKRIYVGTTEGNMFAFTEKGERLYFYDAGAQIESKPAVDAASGEMFFASIDGTVHALTLSGQAKWKTKLVGALRTQPLVTADAVYLVAENDTVTALARDDGRILWTYEKEPVEEMTILGHAGLLFEDGRLFAAFSDGAVAAINPNDGRLFWEVETALDAERRPGNVPQFLDVDTTPILVRGSLYIASFSAGLYALNPANGSVEWREADFRGITGLAAAGRMLVISSAPRGISLLDPRTREIKWERAPERGAPTPPLVTETGTVIYGETQGSLFALSLSDGHEIARAEGGVGFSATPSVAGEFGGALSNGGRFLCLRIN